MINISKPLIGVEEKQAILEVLDSGMLAQGPRVKAFEEAFAEMCDTRYAVATSSGTTALHTALLAHGIGKNDEVITSPFTFIASANSILYVGARPVFVDIEPNTFNIDPAQIEAAITNRTKAIMPIHLFGLCCDMEKITKICNENGLVLLEDACQSHGAMVDGQKAGSFGTGTFSLYPTKNITSAEGGMITTQDAVIAENCRVIRQHGMRQRYFHEELGYNYRMTDIHAAIGLEQIKKLDHFNQMRKQNAAYLSEHLHRVIPPYIPDAYEHVFHQYTIRVPDGQRSALVDHLLSRGIGSGVYYPIPIHKQIYYTQVLRYELTLPESEKACNEVLSLPVHPGLSQDDLDQIVLAVNDFFN